MHTPVIRIQRKYFVNRIRDYQVSKCHALSWAFFIHLFSTTAVFRCCRCCCCCYRQTTKQHVHVELNTKWNLSRSIRMRLLILVSSSFLCFSFFFTFHERTRFIRFSFLLFFQIKEAIWFDFLYGFWLGFGILNELQNNTCVNQWLRSIRHLFMTTNNTCCWIAQHFFAVFSLLFWEHNKQRLIVQIIFE